MIKSAVHIQTHTNPSNNSLTDHIFASKAIIDNQEYVVGLVIHEDANGKRYYDHEMLEMKKLYQPSGLPRGNNIHRKPKGDKASIMSIIDNAINVKQNPTLKNPMAGQHPIP